MKKTTILMLGLVLLFLQANCQQKKSKTIQSKVVVNKKIKDGSTKNVFENLDIILSPFEDMTEYALDKNEAGILKSLKKIEEATNNSVFSKNLSAKSIMILNPKILRLKGFIKQKKYKQIAIASTDIFEYNVSNFINAKKIENQIHIEHLDYMGFKVLALLNQDNIDWKNIDQTIFYVQKEWLTLSPKVRDRNLKDSFNYLFKGLHLSTNNKNIQMSKILAFMDLSLVDVLEKSI